MDDTWDEVDKESLKGEKELAEYLGHHHSSSYGDLGVMSGPYFNHGEYGILFGMKGYGGQVLKIMNLDAFTEGEPDEANRIMWDFLDEWRMEGIKNLPKIHYWLEQEVYPETIHTVKMLCAHNNKMELYDSILDFEVGDTIGAYSVELLDIPNTDFDTLSQQQKYRKMVAQAVVNIYEETGEVLTDFRKPNVGMRGETCVIFDFKVMPWMDKRYNDFVYATDKVNFLVDNWNRYVNA